MQTITKLKFLLALAVGALIVKQFFNAGNKDEIVSPEPDSKLESEAFAEERKERLENMGMSARIEAFWGAMIADALSMPVHWFYDVPAIKRTYGHWIADYDAPKDKHPSCILHLSNPSGSGRGSGTSKPVIGRIILQDKLKYWTEIHNTHYHQGMKAGENTLNSICALSVAKSLHAIDPQRKSIDWTKLAEKVFEDYVDLMTTPGSHNDTYAESFHRAFFAAWETAGSPKSGSDILKFATERKRGILDSESEDHQLEVVGSLVMAIPWILHYSDEPVERCKEAAWNFVSLTHPLHTLKPFVELYSTALHSVINGESLQKVANEALESPVLGGKDTLVMVGNARMALETSDSLDKRLAILQSTGGQMGIACYIQGAMKIIFLLAAEYATDFESGVLANTNIGGENCHRGSALGALLGAESAKKSLIAKKWKDNLRNRDLLMKIV